MNPLSATLSDGQFQLVYNVLSLGLASMLFTSIFLFVARERVLPRYRMAVMVSGTVTAIATYHYFRMFDNFNHAFAGMTGNNPAAYNVGYRYVDWLLTVPLLLVELVAVLALARGCETLITILAPEVIVFGGGLARSGDLLLKPIEDYLKSSLTFQRMPELKVAHYGAKAGTIGCAMIAFDALKAEK